MAKLLLGLAPQQQQTFYSSYSGFKFLKESNEDVRELGNVFPQKSWIGPFDNKEVQEMVSYLIDSKPSAIVIDGEVTLLSVLSSLFVCPIFALANPFDLYNQQLPVSLQSIFRAFYVCADAVICGSFFLLPEDITPLCNNKAYYVPPLVRPELIQSWKGSKSRIILVVLGGGSNGDIELYEGTNNLLREIIAIAPMFSKYEFHICGWEYHSSNYIPSNIHFHKYLMNYISLLAKSRLVIARSGRNTVAEVLSVGTPAVLIPIAKESYRFAEQKANALYANLVNPNIVFYKSSCEERWQDLLQKLLDINYTAVKWKPGNNILTEMLNS
ncbi:hypothetical protein KA005_84315 [bacterium]|nr:hypothetical protein [bacterium]